MNHTSQFGKTGTASLQDTSRWRRGVLALLWRALPLSAATAFEVTDGIVPHASDWRPAEITVPRVPPFVAALAANGGVRLLTLEQIRTQFVAAGANWPATQHRHTEFLVADHGWFQRFLDWQHYFLWEFDHRYQREGFDCDDFSVSMMAFVDLAMLRAGMHSQAAVVGRLVVRQKNRWANAQAGGGTHEVILIATDHGLTVVEPQNRWTIPLEDYPNRAHILRLILN
ncbi:MAG: hypothetical protein HY736_19000 [Verrucomicrobia bacterium]|nr:hypothetical protein [Verrucomicrobiota bacterium]